LQSRHFPSVDFLGWKLLEHRFRRSPFTSIERIKQKNCNGIQGPAQ
jgi:hypothetical protein